MTAVEELVDTLLYEGYALYPYTPGATKNATPTPFGIVYPPAYAAQQPTTFDEIRMPCIVDLAEPDAAATLAVSVRFLHSSGVRHEAAARRVDLPATPLSELERRPALAAFDHDGLRGSVRMSAERLPGGLARIVASVRNVTPVAAGLTRSQALLSSLLSTHVVATVTGGRFASPTAPPEHAAGAVMTCVAVNTFPVLASAGDTVMLGAAIMLPDHPQIAPESRGSLFDATEIEEALRLHLLALSDGERRELEQHDPALRSMLERAIASAPQDLAALHGRVTVSDPAMLAEPPGADDVRGEEQARVGDAIVRRGDRVRLRPAVGRHAQDHLLNGRTATVERIYVDYDDRVHLCVTVDDDPGQQLMRDIGRYLYFKPTEVEALP
ncbi:MAG: hypothetical protein ACXVFL_08965 [Solirubrobacteraceae bacterium]